MGEGDAGRATNVKSVELCKGHSYLAVQASSGVTIYEQAESATAYHSEVLILLFEHLLIEYLYRYKIYDLVD